jgi:hypothetical protein
MLLLTWKVIPLFGRTSVSDSAYLSGPLATANNSRFAGEIRFLSPLLDNELGRCEAVALGC